MNKGDQVEVVVKSVDDMGFIVNIPLHHNREGFILMSDQFKYKSNYVIGQHYQCIVKNVDNQRGYVDLKFLETYNNRHVQLELINDDD